MVVYYSMMENTPKYITQMEQTRMRLLGTGNTKTVKGEAYGYQTFIMHLAPSTVSGYNVCPMASLGCAAACLNTAGRGQFKKTQAARIAKTRWFFQDRTTFMAQLIKDVEAGIRKAKRENLIPVFRLNGTSDIRWETIEVPGAPNIMNLFPTVQFYDYTKLPNRNNVPSNYHLTFSRSESNQQHVEATSLNIAVVFTVLPTTYLGRPVVNGVDTDLTFTYPSNVVVGLLAKGKAKKDVSGFVVKDDAMRVA